MMISCEDKEMRVYSLFPGGGEEDVTTFYHVDFPRSIRLWQEGVASS